MKEAELINQINQINKVGNRIFLTPKPTLSYEELVQRSLGSNTFRGFHKVDKEGEGASAVFRRILTKNKENIINAIRESNSEECINTLSNNIGKKLRKNLVNNRPEQLISFNKIRKPVDIFIEHIVAMGSDFDKPTRRRVTKWLYLPLDSQMFKSPLVFSDAEIEKFKIKRTFTFKDIWKEIDYYEIQSFLKEKSKKAGIENRIYFDLLWNDRYGSSGNNLFETNPQICRIR